MGQMQYSLASRSYTVADSSNIDTSYPASNIGILFRPRRATRSVNTSAPTITLDLGATSPVAIQAFSIEGHNFGALRIEGNATDSWGAPSFGQDYVTTASDAEDGRRKLLCVPTAAFESSYRYVKLIPSSLDAGATYYTLGIFGVWPVLSSMTRNPSVPYVKQLVDSAEDIELGSGTREIGTTIPTTAMIGLETNYHYFDDTSIAAQWLALGRVARSTVILWYENQSDLTKLYHMQRISFATITRTTSMRGEYRAIQFREVA